MSGCIDCGCETPNRRCRQCAIERRAEASFENHDWDEDEDEKPDVLTDGGEEDHTHYCEDCEMELSLLWDDRDDEETAIVCGHCGGTNTRRLVATDGGEDDDRVAYQPGDSDLVTFEQVGKPKPRIRIEQVGADPVIRYRYEWDERGDPTPEQFERVGYLDTKLVTMLPNLDGEVADAADAAYEAITDLLAAMADARGLDDGQRQAVAMGNLEGLPEVERRTGREPIADGGESTRDVDPIGPYAWKLPRHGHENGHDTDLCITDGAPGYWEHRGEDVTIVGWDEPTVDPEREPISDGGNRDRDLPESLDTLVERAEHKDEIECRDCGDAVQRRFAEDGRCPGCQYGTPLIADGGTQATLGDPDDELFGLIDLTTGDELRVTYETPRSDYDQQRTGRVAEIGQVEREHGPTHSPKVVLKRTTEEPLVLWPEWDEIRTESAGRLGEVIDVERVERAESQQLVADGGELEGSLEPVDVDADELVAELEADRISNPYQIGDPVMDCAQGRPMVVVDAPDESVRTWSVREDYDLTENYANSKFDCIETEPVVECVYVSDVRSEPSKTYTFPASRLRLIDAHHADDGRRIYERVALDVLERLIATGHEYDGTGHCPGPAEIATHAGIPEDLVDEARELADVEQTVGTGDATDPSSGGGFET